MDSEEKKPVLSYEKLFELLRSEKSKPGLQKVPKDFFEQVQIYLDLKKQDVTSSQQSNNMFASRQADDDIKQYSNAKKIIRMLYDLREKKLVGMALNKSRTASSIIDTSGLHEKEIRFFKEMVEVCDTYRKQILEYMMSSPQQPDQQAPMDNGMQMVRFLDQVKDLKDDKGNVLGHFSEEDVANIPASIANNLLEQGKVQFLSMPSM